jgi:signal transduction histidine kinase
LEHSNQHLKDTLQNLQTTRDELVRSEKLAALGALVAGVSHELNTPIGNSLTVASTIDAQVSDFSAAMTKGLTRSALDGFVSEVREGIDILLRSLHRAVELVSSFKQVAVDQTSENRREFFLRETVNEILLTLGPTMRRTPHTLTSDIPSDIRLESYPGPLGQVLTNLINNALIHGLKDSTDGKIALQVRSTREGWVQFTVQDNGAGIAPQHLDRVFDPFFTTRLGQGGSGLGLNIVYNIVTQTLGGTIRVESVQGQGARFIMNLPCIAPARVTDNPMNRLT